MFNARAMPGNCAYIDPLEFDAVAAAATHQPANGATVIC
jgi:hypothetical protein